MSLPSSKLFIIMLAASFASTIGGLPFNSLPILLGSLSDTFGFSVQQVGLLGSGCFTGYLAGTLVAAVFMNRMPWRLLTIISALGAAIALIASANLSAEAQLPLWVIVGFFAALMTCLGLRIMGDMPDKEQALGLRQGVELSVTAGVLFVLPTLVIANYEYQGAALALAGIILLLSVSALALPKHAGMMTQNFEPEQLRDLFSLPPVAVAALICFLAFGTGQIGLWAFLERIGAALELRAAELGTVFAVLKLLGGGAALALAFIGDRLGLRLPHFVVFLIIVVGLVLLAIADSFWPYALGAWIWEVGFTWGCLYQVAAIARLDPSGRSIMLIPAAFALSSMAGPAIAGSIIASGFAPLLWLAFGTAIIPVIAFGLVIYKILSGHEHNGEVTTGLS